MPAARFADVLDRHLDAPRGGVRPAGWSAGARVARGFVTPPLAGAPFISARAAARIFTSARPQPRRHACEMRPARLLNARQRRALDVLRGAGAVDLRDDYLTGELKSAFRRLARQLHPDRRPGASADERAEMSARFREVREAYGVLQA